MIFKFEVKVAVPKSSDSLEEHYKFNIDGQGNPSDVLDSLGG